MPQPSSAPNFPDFHRSIGAELSAVKDRVRQLIRHWPTDGTFKESVLRYVLRRFLPDSLSLGTGFVVTADWASPQMDILIVSRDHPRLFSDGDLLIVAPDAVRWAIEVKTRVTTRTLLRKTVMKLAEARANWSDTPGGGRNRASLFIYQAKQELVAPALYALDEARARYGLQVGSITLGTDIFIESVDGAIEGRELDGWVATIEPGMSAAHFVNYIIQPQFGRGDWTSRSAPQSSKLPAAVIKYLPFSDDVKHRNQVESFALP
jgi:hypothetical protein